MTCGQGGSDFFNREDAKSAKLFFWLRSFSSSRLNFIQPYDTMD
jgi:hypothetical protein